MKVGILALQGAFAAHGRVLDSLGAAAIEVRGAQDLGETDRLIIPGGESTTMSLLAETNDLLAPLKEYLNSGKPVFGTCAGAILLARCIEGGRADQHVLDALDITVERNAFGTQRESFSEDLEIAGLDSPFHAVFIRAPRITARGASVETLAALEGSPALVRSGSVLVSTFHPELSADSRLHEMFLAIPRGK